MGRLQPPFLERVESFADRVLDVVDALPAKVSGRVVDQMVGAGTAVGANVFEADEALSRKDFCKCIGIAAKELNEARYWLRLAGRRGWVPARRLSQLEAESQELRRIFSSMITRTVRSK